MASAADRFSRLEKVAVFLIALGEQRSREILADVDLDTLQHLNDALAGLGAVSAEEKAAVMLEFAHFFYEDRPLTPGPSDGGDTASGKPPPPSPKGARRKGPGPGPASTAGQATSDLDLPDLAAGGPALTDEEQAILKTLDRLRRKVDPGQIDWGRAGYDFGEGFKGPEGDRR